MENAKICAWNSIKSRKFKTKNVQKILRNGHQFAEIILKMKKKHKLEEKLGNVKKKNTNFKKKI